MLNFDFFIMPLTDKNLLIKSVKLVDPLSGFTGQQQDIHIRDGQIRQFGENLNVSDAEVIQMNGACLSPGWFDLNATFGEPGQEVREDLESGSRAAIKGGFTGLALMPDTEPALHSKSEIEFILHKAALQPIEIIPVGAISHKREGKEMAEMYDMWLSGVRAFSDGDRPVQHAGLLTRALQYTSDFGGLIMSNPEDQSIAAGAKVHESLNTLVLGMKGIPSLAEELMVSRDLMLAEYTSCRIHFSTISTAGSVELIRVAKKRGLKVTAAVAAHHLILDDGYLSAFDSNYKVKPPLRGLNDKLALIAGIYDGTIDAVCSQHNPQLIEVKQVEFESAAYGMIGLETCYSLLNMALGPDSIETIVKLLAYSPRTILGLEIPALKIGQAANFTLFDPALKWILKKEDLGSKSLNSPWLGKEIQGKVLAVFVNGHFYKN